MTALPKFQDITYPMLKKEVFDKHVFFVWNLLTTYINKLLMKWINLIFYLQE